MYRPPAEKQIQIVRGRVGNEDGVQMTKKEQEQVISVLTELQAKVRTRKLSSISNQKAARARMEAHDSNLERGWFKHWNRVTMANETVDAMLTKLIEEQRQCQISE